MRRGLLMNEFHVTVYRAAQDCPTSNTRRFAARSTAPLFVKS